MNTNRLFKAIEHAKKYSFDRVGADSAKEDNEVRGAPCHCSWSSSTHGDTCPEHGKPGIKVPELEEWFKDNMTKITSLYYRLAPTLLEVLKKFPGVQTSGTEVHTIVTKIEQSLEIKEVKSA